MSMRTHRLTSPSMVDDRGQLSPMADYVLKSDFNSHAKSVENFLVELGPYLGLDDGIVKTQDFIASAARIREGYAAVQARCSRLENALRRAQTVLSNMALENEGAIFARWPISHEPLRSDAKHLLPIIDEALSQSDGDSAMNPKGAP